MMNLVPNNDWQPAGRYRQVSGPARVGAARDATRTEEALIDHVRSGRHDNTTPPTPLGVPFAGGRDPDTPTTDHPDPGPDRPVTESDQRSEAGGRRVRPTLAVLIGAPTLVVVVLAALISLYAQGENTATERVAGRISSAQDQYRVAADADRAVSQAQVAVNQGVITATKLALDRAERVLRRQSDELTAIIERAEMIAGNADFDRPLAVLLASNRSYLDGTLRLIEFARRTPDAAQAALGFDRESYEQRLAEHEALSRDLSRELNRLTAELDDQRGEDVLLFPLLPLALTIVAFVLAVWAWRATVKPLRRVSRTLDQVAHGRFQVRSDLGGNDDLGRVGQATDRLAQRLGNRFSTLSDDARRNAQNRVISETLETADSEAATFAVVEQAMGLFAPGLQGELLLLDATSGDLGEVAASPSSGSPGCPVTDPTDCVALRRGQSTVFDSSESINGCPMLQNRPGGPISALCIPMTFNSSPLGVIHLTGPSQQPPDGPTSNQFVALATQTASHVGALRTLEFTRRQASTDGLTGLANRQVIEANVARLLRQRTPFVVVLADLDRFKSINDRFGHEAGDRALQTFATVVSQNVRGADVVGRLGGDEFVIIYPELSVAAAGEAIERLRTALDEAVAAGLIVPFTASFGLVHSTMGSDFTDLVRLADAGLLVAKEQGRDRTIAASPELVRQVFSAERPTGH